MFRTFVDLNGNIQYFPLTTDLNIYYNNIIPDPYSNSSIFIKKNPDIIYSESDSPLNSITIIPKQTYYASNTIYDVNNDPDLRRRITTYFYNKYIDNWLPFSFIKLQKYLKNENGKIDFIKNMSEYDNKVDNDDLKIDFILDNIFGKHEIVKFLDKFVRNNNVNWYDLKTKHIDRIKNDLYEKIKNLIKKIVIKKL